MIHFLLKTFQMIKMCNKYFDYDFLIKIDSSIVGYGERKKVGYSKKVRSFYYSLDRVKFLLENDHNLINKSTMGVFI